MRRMIIKITGMRVETGACVFAVNGHRIQHAVRHSPTGMEYGYSGSGPADLARSILLAVMPTARAEKYYQQFKHDFVAAWKGDLVDVTIDLDAWIAKQGGK